MPHGCGEDRVAMSGKVLAETGVFLRAAPVGEARAGVYGPVEEPRGI